MWRYNGSRMLTLHELFITVIQKLCLKHHMGILPLYFTKNAMPSMNDNQLEYRITHVSLETMCDYKIVIRSSEIHFRENSIKY